MRSSRATQQVRPWLLAGMAAVGALTCALSGPVRADMMLLAGTTMVTGTESATYSFTAPSAGTVTAELTNLDWPQALSGLSFMASAPGQVLASWSDPAQSNALTSTHALTFQVGGPGTYFANVTATPGGPLDIGVYSFSLHFNNGSPVPLPASGWMLAAAVIVLIGMLRSRRGRRALDASPLPAAH